MPKVSVIVPIYNVENYLRQAIDSILNQTLDDIEVILIDDGSTDSSSKIIDDYLLDKRVSIIHKQNEGYGKTCNLGLLEATGEYVIIIEPDDFVDKNMLKDMYSLAIRNDSDLVKAEYFNTTIKNKKVIARKTAKFLKYRKNKPVDIFKYPSLIRIIPSIWTCLYKNDFLKRNNIKFLETKGAAFQDTSFSFKTLSLAKNIILTDNAYLYYRCDNSNASVKAKDKTYSITNEYLEIDRFLFENPKIKEKINSEKLIKQYRAYIWNLARIDKEFVNGFIEKFYQTFKNYFDNEEITKAFYRKINKNKFVEIINDKEKFKKEMLKKANRMNKKNSRRKLFSIRINANRISIVLFGIQVMEIG